MNNKNTFIFLNNGNMISIHNAQRYLRWGTYGKYGKEPLHWVRLIDCSTEHLLNILCTQHHRTMEYDIIIKSILHGRNVDTQYQTTSTWCVLGKIN